MDARISERRPKNLVFDVIERHLAPGGLPLQAGPDAVDLANAVSRSEREPAAANRVVIDDGGDRECVIGVDPEREPLGVCP
jgi:hypothetical protein